MKKLIIRHKDFILRVHALENNIIIFDSYLVKNPQDMKSIILSLKREAVSESTVNKINTYSILHKWKTYNLIYSLGVLRNKVKNITISIDQTWTAKVSYFIISLFYSHSK